MCKNNYRIGVIISTYNNPRWLEKVFWGYMKQSHSADEIIVADDGSTDETRLLIEKYKKFLPLNHVWHEDNGFQKSKILNKAIKESMSEYLIFTDQDCIPRKDFIQTHIKYAEKGFFLSGGYFKLPMQISLDIIKEDVDSERAFSLRWLYNHGVKLNEKCLKLVNCNFVHKLLNKMTTAKATFNGCNSSVWREDIFAVNGFNEDMQYGGQDREMGERLHNLSIKSKQIRHSALVLHLDHKRPYKTEESMKKNKEILRLTETRRITFTKHGIVQV